MGKVNNAVNQLLERKEIFADFINGVIFNGEQLLKPEKMELLSANTGFYYEEDKKKKLIERHGDIRKENWARIRSSFWKKHKRVSIMECRYVKCSTKH